MCPCRTRFYERTQHAWLNPVFGIQNIAAIHRNTDTHSTIAAHIARLPQSKQMSTVIDKRRTTGTATRTARYELRGLPTAPNDKSGHEQWHSTRYVPVLLQRWTPFTDVSSAQASVCKKSGEAGVANMEAAGLNRNTSGRAVQWPNHRNTHDFPTVSERLRSGAHAYRRPMLPCIPLIGTAYSPLRLRNGLPVPSRTQATTLARRCSAATPRFANSDQGRLCVFCRAGSNEQALD